MEHNILEQLQIKLERNKYEQTVIKRKIEEKRNLWIILFIHIIAILFIGIFPFKMLNFLNIFPRLLVSFISLGLSTSIFYHKCDKETYKILYNDFMSGLNHNYRNELKSLMIEREFINQAFEKYKRLQKLKDAEKNIDMKSELIYLDTVHSLLSDYTENRRKIIKADKVSYSVLNDYNFQEENALLEMAATEEKIKSIGQKKFR